MARNKKGRPVSGILLLDKPSGLSSNQALQQIKRVFGARKAGHTGTLDPFATGMLPICLGEATKVAHYLTDASKAYSAKIVLGQQTSTGDPEGEVIETTPIPEFLAEDLEEVLGTFAGELEQTPPMYSALKKDGKRLYQLAREGVEVARDPRRIWVHELSLVEHGKNWLAINVVCSKGTYIRVLAEDIARGLGTVGYCQRLRRTAVGPFGGAQIYQIEELERRAEQGLDSLDRCLIPADAALGHLPALQVAEHFIPAVINGNAIAVDADCLQGLVRIYGPKQEFLGVGELLAGARLQPRKMFIAPGSD